MPIRELQNVFSLGELDPKLLARADFEGYYKGARVARNMLIQPQGGSSRRFGTTYVSTMINVADANSPITDADTINGIVFNFSPEKTFVIIMRANSTSSSAFEIYLDGALQTTVSTGTYPAVNIKDVQLLHAQNRIIVLHEDIQPHELVRTNDTTWSLTAITFANRPTYDFSIIDGTSYRGGSDTFTPSATSGTGITLTGSSAFFTAGHVGGLFVGGGGVMRITSVNAGGTIATGDTIESFNSTSAIKGSRALLEEVAWGNSSGGTPAGADRGWPSRGDFFQNRLVLGRTLAIKNFVSFSDSGDFYNFDDSEALDTNSFSLSVNSGGNDEVQDIVGARVLVVLGASSIYSSSMFLDKPVTASTIFLNEQDSSGADALGAKILDNQVFYVDSNKQKINAAQYDIAGGSINVIDASLFSPQAVNAPVSTSVYRPETNDGSFLMVANTDGQLSIFQSLVSQQVQGWTINSTRGRVKHTFSNGDTGVLIVERNIGTGTTTAGTLTNVYTANRDFQSFTDITAAAADAGTDVTLFNAENEYLLIGHDQPFYRLAVTLNTAASATIAPTFEYLNADGAWTTFSVTDGTTGFSAAGTILWSLDADTPEWSPINIEDYLTGGAVMPEDTIGIPEAKFWIRIRRTAETLVTAPIEDQILTNTATRLYLENVDFSVYTDGSESTTSNSVGLVTGLDHLQGMQVYALVDGAPDGPHFVDASGEITVSVESSDVKVGLNYIPRLVPMPVVGREFYSQNVYNPKHIKGVFVDYFESLNVTVNGLEVPALHLNNFILDQRPVAQTGFYEVSPMSGWNPRTQIEISQSLPQPMTIIGIGYRLEIS